MKKENRRCLLVLGLVVINLGLIIDLILTQYRTTKYVDIKEPEEKPSKPIVPREDQKGKEKAQKDQEIIGSTGSNKCHKPTCSYAHSISQDNRIHFDSQEDAEKQGYEPCGVCH